MRSFIKLEIMKKANNITKKTTPASLILIKTNQTEKVREILEKEKVNYEIYNSENNLKAKTFSKSRNVKELINSLDKARIKYLLISNN